MIRIFKQNPPPLFQVQIQDKQEYSVRNEHMLVHRQWPVMSQVLVHQQGRVRCRHLPTGEALYAPVERDQHHLTCVSCGETQTLEQCPVHEMKVQAPESDNFKLIFHTLEFFGLCKRCRTER